MNNDKQVIIEQYRLLLQAYLEGDRTASFPVETLAQQASQAGLDISDVTAIFKDVMALPALISEDLPRFAKITEFFTESVQALATLQIEQQAAESNRVTAQLKASEEKFRVIFQEALDVIIIIDGQTGLILDVNQMTLHVLGYQENQLLGQHYSMLMPDFEEPAEQDFLETLEIYGPVFEGQEFLKADGSTCPVDLMATVILWNDEKAVMLSLRDITERKQAEFEISQRNQELLTLAIRHAQLYQQAQQEIADRKQTEERLRSSQELFQQVVSSISDHIYVTEVTASGKLNNIYMSPNVGDLTGYPVETLLKSWSFWPSVLIHPEDRTIAEEQAQRLVAGQSSEAQYRLIRANGQTIWVRDSGRVLAEGDKKIIYGVVGDITERKQRERELEAIATIATALRSALTHTEMVSLMLDPILKLLQIDGATLDIYDPTTNEMVVELARGEWANLIGLRTSADKGIAGHVLTTGQAYIANEAQTDPLIYGPKTLGPLKAIACVPLLAQDQTVAVLWVGRRDEMTADTVRPLSAITDIAANALYRAELFEQLQRSNSKLVRLTTDLEGLVKQRTIDLEQAVTEASEAHDRINAILHSIADGLIVTDLENKVILANPATERLLGFKLDEILGYEIGTGFKDDNLRQIVRGTLNQYINGYEIDIKIKNEGDDRPKIVRAHISLVDDRQGQPLGTVTIIQDVTAIREVDRMKTEFLTTAAHEFRTPLTSVLGFSEILLTRDLDKDRQMRYLTMINTQATHLANIVRDLLDVARLEAGQGLEINPEPTDLGQLISETLLPFREAKSNHTFVEQNLGEIPLVMADRFRLTQVLENLISNAIKYSPEGGPVTISARTVRHHVEISIQDNGIGMTQEQQKHLFEKFYRADTSNTTISGTGLGLALCKLIVELHQGRIWIESEPGQGTNVYFTLPIAQGKGEKASSPS